MAHAFENTLYDIDYPLPVKLGNQLLAHLPIQLKELSDEINTSQYMLQFGDNWDGEGSMSYSPKTWINAITFICNYANWVFEHYNQVIPIPNIYHGPKGSIDFYWEKETFNLLINFPKEDNAPASFYGDNYSTQELKTPFKHHLTRILAN